MAIESTSTSSNRWRRYVKDLLPVNGTFTPELLFGGSAAVTAGNVAGYYTKIGKMVHFKILLNPTTLTVATGAATITGLPFTTSDDLANTSVEGGCYCVFNSGMSSLTSGVHGRVAGTTITLQDQGATAVASLTDANFNNGCQINLIGSYWTDG